MHLLSYENNSLLINLSKFWKIMCHYSFVLFLFFFFQYYANYVLRPKLCDSASAQFRKPCFVSLIEYHVLHALMNLFCLSVSVVFFFSE